MVVEIVQVGAPASLQNFGQTGLRAYGVTVGGVMDKDSAAITNLLVGNEVETTVIEFTQPGLTVRFLQDAWVAVGGAQMSVTLDGSVISMWRAVFVERGCVLRCVANGDGVWAYLAMAGGFQFANDRAIVAGREVVSGMRLSFAAEGHRFTESSLKPNWMTQLRAQPPQRNRQRIQRDVRTTVHLIRVLPGEHASLWPSAVFADWFKQPFRVSHQRNRIGYRLEGKPLPMDTNLPSQPIVPGTVQLPPSGLPIVLQADCQTIGGYPVIAHVIEADLGAMAQVGAGQLVCFQEVTMEMARVAWMRQRKDWQQLKVGLACCRLI